MRLTRPTTGRSVLPRVSDPRSISSGPTCTCSTSVSSSPSASGSICTPSKAMSFASSSPLISPSGDAVLTRPFAADGSFSCRPFSSPYRRTMARAMALSAATTGLTVSRVRNCTGSTAKTLVGSAIASCRIGPSRDKGTTQCDRQCSRGTRARTSARHLARVEVVHRRQAVLLRDQVRHLPLAQVAELHQDGAEAPAGLLLLLARLVQLRGSDEARGQRQVPDAHAHESLLVISLSPAFIDVTMVRPSP